MSIISCRNYVVNNKSKILIKSSYRMFSISKITESKLTLYGFPISQPTRSIQILLKENNIPYNFHIIDAIKGENRKPDFLKLHPAGLVPFIQDDDYTLGESCAIMVIIFIIISN